MPEFTKDGHVSRFSKPIPMAVAAAARNIGQLPKPERQSILDQFARRRRS